MKQDSNYQQSYSFPRDPKMKKTPLRDYQHLVNDPLFKSMFENSQKWQTYRINNDTWLCTEIIDLVRPELFSKLAFYCFRRNLEFVISPHVHKPEYICLMIRRSPCQRLTEKKINLPPPSDEELMGYIKCITR